MQNSLNNIETAQAPAVNTAAVWTGAAQTDGSRWSISSILWSYSGTPTAGSIVIAWGSVSVTLYVTVGGPGQFNFPIPLQLPSDTAVTVTLAAGGSGVTGTVYTVASTGS
jgi:hypothetical protein